MAVYTKLSDPEISTLLRQYDIGTLLRAEGITQGVENTNYLLEVQKGETHARYILTLFEKRAEPEALPFFMGVMREMAEAGIPSALPIAQSNGEVLAQCKGKHAAIVEFLEGKAVTVPNLAQMASLGAMLARMHEAAESSKLMRKNALSLEGWFALYEKTAAQLDSITPGLNALVGAQLQALAKEWPQELPRGVVHADVFPDNVFFTGDDVSGVIDFYFACHDAFAYDLAITINAWCFDATRQFVPERKDALLAAYEKVRPLSDAEKQAMPVLLRGAAIRFLMTRSHDKIFHDENAQVVPHDPMEYVEKLRFYCENAA